MIIVLWSGRSAVRMHWIFPSWAQDAFPLWNEDLLLNNRRSEEGRENLPVIHLMQLTGFFSGRMNFADPISWILAQVMKGSSCCNGKGKNTESKEYLRQQFWINEAAYQSISKIIIIKLNQHIGSTKGIVFRCQLFTGTRKLLLKSFEFRSCSA